jgi:flagellar basal body rod protein FlgB
VPAPTKAIKTSGRISRSTSRNSEKRNKPDEERDSNKVSMEEEETTAAKTRVRSRTNNDQLGKRRISF